jgi:hypothetical protein
LVISRRGPVQSMEIVAARGQEGKPTAVDADLPGGNHSIAGGERRLRPGAPDEKVTAAQGKPRRWSAHPRSATPRSPRQS